MQRKSFIFRTDWLLAVEGWPPEEAQALIMAVLRYAAHGQEPEGLSPYAVSLFGVIHQQIDKNNIKYANGLQGGRPRKENDMTITQELRKELLTTFFFRNFTHPEKEVERYIAWGESVGWKKNGRTIINILRYSTFWKPEDEGVRFPSEVLGLLRQAYEDGCQSVLNAVKASCAGERYVLYLRGDITQAKQAKAAIDAANEKTIKIQIIYKVI